MNTRWNSREFIKPLRLPWRSWLGSNGADNGSRAARIEAPRITRCVGLAQSLRSGQSGRAHRPASCRAGCGRSLGVCDPHGARPRPARGACRCIYATTTHYPATGAPPHSPQRALRPLFPCPVQRLLEAEQIPHKVKPVSDYRNLGDIYVEQIASSTDVRQAPPPPPAMAPRPVRGRLERLEPTSVSAPHLCPPHHAAAKHRDAQLRRHRRSDGPPADPAEPRGRGERCASGVRSSRPPAEPS